MNPNATESDAQEEIITAKGVLNRSITAANNASMGMNAFLDITLEGELKNGWRLTGHISDQNMPYQATGNYHNVSDYDELGIRLTNSRASFEMGNLLLEGPSTRLNFRKQILGAAIGWADSSSSFSWAGGMTQGKFVSLPLDIIPGVSGPYRLHGNDGDDFITIVPGTERILLDGEELVRGPGQDYIIDYFTAEVTFSQNIQLFSNSRVFVSFEYTNQAYRRSFHQVSVKKSSQWIQAYLHLTHEKDNALRPVMFEMSEPIYDYLAGERGQLPIRYHKTDTVDDAGSRIEIYIPSVSGGEEIMFIPSPEGDYIDNGQYYDWVGRGNGTHTTARIPDAPMQESFIESGVAVTPTANEKVYFAVEFANKNENHLLDTTAIRGYTVGAGLLSSGRQFFSSRRTWSSDLSYKKISRGYQPMNLAHQMEQMRIWSGIPQFTGESQELTGAYSMMLDEKEKLYLGFTHRTDPVIGKGNRYQVRVHENIRNWGFSASMTDIRTASNGSKREWHDSQYTVRHAGLGYDFIRQGEMIESGSERRGNGFYEHAVYLTLDSLQQDKIRIGFREDWFTDHEGQLKRRGMSLASLNAGVKTDYVTYSTRNFATVKWYGADTAGFNDNISSSHSFSSTLFKKSWNLQATYALHQGREIQRQYTFMQVPFGQGTHMWRDDNGNGEKELDEFYEALNPDERLYAKFFTPTQQYIQAYQQRIQFLSTFSMMQLTDIQALKKIRWQFQFTQMTKDTSLLNLQSARLGENYLLNNRLQLPFSHFSLMLENRTQRQQYLTMRGLEGTANTNQRLEIRKSVLRSSDIVMAYRNEQKEVNSALLERRNYTIQVHEWDGRYEALFKDHLRFVTAVLHTRKFGESITRTNATIWTISQQMSYRARLVDFSAQWQSHFIQFSGDMAENISYDMLDGLQPGRNHTMRLQAASPLRDNLMLDITYFGRGSANASFIHFGEISIRYIFN